MPIGAALNFAKSLAATAAPFVKGAALASTGGQMSSLTRIAAGLGAIGGTEQGQRVAVDQPAGPPSETAASGEQGITNIISTGAPAPMIPASYGVNIPASPQNGIVRASGPLAVIPPAISAGRGILAMLGLAGGAITVAPIIIDPLTGEKKTLRVTRKLKSDVKKAVEMFGVEFVAEKMGADVEVVFYILTKKMRNDGPYVTKAAVRKTRQAVRKMKTLCDMYDDLRPAARRRAPARKTMSTRITNVK